MAVPETSLSLVDERTKGVPPGVGPFDIGDIGARNWNLLREDLILPVAVLKQSELEHNSKWMKDFLAANGMKISPHGKTSMSPELFDLQQRDGAWAMTFATVHQVLVGRSFGHKRIVMANQLVGRAGIRAILEELKADPEFDFYCLVDSVETVEALVAGCDETDPGRPLQVLLEIGYADGRTGCRDRAGAMAVLDCIARHRGRIVLAGIEGFEGYMRGKDGVDTETLIRNYLGFVVDMAEHCLTNRLFDRKTPILSAGGSVYYDIVAKLFNERGMTGAFLVLLRSGCYLTHDDILYRKAFAAIRSRSPELTDMDGGLRPALEVWAYVQSLPEPGRAIVNFGKRDVGYDDLPVPLKHFRPGRDSEPYEIREGFKVARLNDQHCHMDIPEKSGLAVGDMIAFGISHPCLTFDKWRMMYVTNDRYDIVSAARTFF